MKARRFSASVLLLQLFFCLSSCYIYYALVIIKGVMLDLRVKAKLYSKVCNISSIQVLFLMLSNHVYIPTVNTKGPNWLVRQVTHLDVSVANHTPLTECLLACWQHIYLFIFKRTHYIIFITQFKCKYWFEDHNVRKTYTLLLRKWV